MIFISIHALLTESDCVACCIISDRPNISIHALLTESDLFYCFFALCYVISIHALLTESDHSRRSRKQRHPNFYPRSPYGERLEPPIKTHRQKHFYPRSPYGERRLDQIQPRRFHYHFYPRSPYGERLDGSKSSIEEVSISIHALLTESDANQGA